MTHPVITPKTYSLIFVALLALTGLTMFLADASLSATGHVVVALSIAGVKALLVVLFFMHLLYSSRLIWLVVATGLVFLAILMTFTLADYWTRHWMPQYTTPGATALIGIK